MAREIIIFINRTHLLTGFETIVRRGPAIAATATMRKRTTLSQYYKGHPLRKFVNFNAKSNEITIIYIVNEFE